MTISSTWANRPVGATPRMGFGEGAAIGHVRGDPVVFGDEAQQVEAPVGERRGPFFRDGARSGRVA
jgi:hypothetical protein